MGVQGENDQTSRSWFFQVERRGKMDLGLKGKVGMVTGASRGIGKACALALSGEGCNLAICARGKGALDEVAEEIKAKGVEVLAIQGDVTKPEDIKNFVTKAAEKFGRIDILVNNAGAGRLSDVMELPEEEFRYNMDLMLFGPIQCCKEVIPHMRKQGWGRIINISSIFGKQPGGLLDYDAIKAAVNMFTKDMANYLAKDNILVNAVCPGPIRTPLWEGSGQLGDQLGQMLGMSGQEAIKWFAEQNIPLGHHGDPEDIADMVTFLASERAKFITGQAINVDGGMVKATV
jgi:3-oxoacyl-[acyl-carrier protein] reductase